MFIDKKSPALRSRGFLYSNLIMAQEIIKERTTFSDALSFYNVHWRAKLYAIVAMIIILLIVMLFALSIGSTDIPFLNICKILLNKIPFIHLESNLPDNMVLITLDIRLPRIVLAGLVGAALAVSGTEYQGLFRNPLADPYLIGVAQGAGLGAVIGFLSPISMQFISVPLLAFLGALVTVLTVYFIARVNKTLPMTILLLAGFALGAFLLALTSHLMIASGDRSHGIISWLLGTLSLINWQQILISTPYTSLLEYQLSDYMRGY